MEIIRDGDEPVAIRINGHEFACEEETYQIAVPKNVLTGIRLSAIPDDITIKPVESIKGNVIETNHDFELTAFRGGESSAIVEEMFRRKFWDGDVGLTPYVTALRKAIEEDDISGEIDFEDDGDYIFLHYEVTISEDLEVQDASAFVDGVIERLHERADQVAHRRRDGLLGIFDRGGFEADLNYALRRKQGVALIMVDIDHFKKVNDTLGHLVGDEVLRRVAKVLSERCDGMRRVEYRYGGEEFVVILTGDGAFAAAVKLAEAIRTDVESLRFDDHDLALTVSIGVAGAGEDRDKKLLLKRADSGLYRAKREGRNRVVSVRQSSQGEKDA